MSLAPIALFVYNRPEQTRRTLSALLDNELSGESCIYIFCDGARNDANASELAKIEEVKNIVTNVSGFKHVDIRINHENKGLADSIIDGVTEVINSHKKIIVLEDDILTSRFFLRFMNDNLDLYQSTDKIFSIGACNYFAEGNRFSSKVFIPIPDCWGWATWADRWASFEKNTNKLIQLIAENRLSDPFNLYGFYNFNDMLQDQLTGKINSWAIRWQANCYLQHKLNIYPNPSITQHMHSTSGTHMNGVNVEPVLAEHRFEKMFETPKLLQNVFKSMLKTYFMYFVNDRFSKLKHRVKFMTLYLKKSKDINVYIKMHNL